MTEKSSLWRFAAKWIPVMLTIGYLAFPVISGAWFHNRIQCTYMWSEAAKNGLSIAAYIALGFLAWRKLRPDVLTSDGAWIGNIAAGFLGIGFAFTVLDQCW